ncbi:MAG: hypothetical protein WKF77_29655 [Planctomycetaceae bacterium]
MKRSLSQFATRMHRRRGALFHYYLAYVTLVSSVLMMTGTCLHTILQSEQTDRRVSLFLHSLLRCERMLRTDADTAQLTVDSDSALTIAREDGVQVHWVADRGILTRQETRGSETLNSDRFVFPAGSKIEFSNRDDGATVLKFFEPSVFVKYSEMGSGGLNRNKPLDEAFPTTPAAAAAQPLTEIVLQ